MKLPGLTESTIRAGTSNGSYTRGAHYHNTGAVLSVKPNGKQQIEALVKGSDLAPYTVRIGYEQARVVYVECTCPYHAGSWCKHVVAVLLTCLHGTEQPDPDARLEALLDGLDREALVSLIKRLVAQDPTLMDRLEQVRSIDMAS